MLYILVKPQNVQLKHALVRKQIRSSDNHSSTSNRYNDHKLHCSKTQRATDPMITNWTARKTQRAQIQWSQTELQGRLNEHRYNDHKLHCKEDSTSTDPMITNCTARKWVTVTFSSLALWMAVALQTGETNQYLLPSRRQETQHKPEGKMEMKNRPRALLLITHTHTHTHTPDQLTSN